MREHTADREGQKLHLDFLRAWLEDKPCVALCYMAVPVSAGAYANDMTTFHNPDDVLTLLVHLGYLGYDADAGEASVPNREVMGEWANATADPGWREVARSVTSAYARSHAAATRFPENATPQRRRPPAQGGRPAS